MNYINKLHLLTIMLDIKANIYLAVNNNCPLKRGDNNGHKQ